MTRARLLAAAVLALSFGAAAAQDLGGHDAPGKALEQAAPADARRATLEEMWQRRLLPPDQDSWSPQDEALLTRIRASERDAISYLNRTTGGSRPWTARAPSGSAAGWRLTKEGYTRYVFLLSQDAVAYFEKKGADAKWVFKLKDWDDKPMFDGAGLLTEEGARVYRLAKYNLEVFWRAPNGDAYGTRRPPSSAAAAAVPAPPPAVPTKSP
jgi:hypothetical protein